MAHTQESKGNQSKLSEGTKTLDLLHRNLKSAILNMFKELNRSSSEKVKKE